MKQFREDLGLLIKEKRIQCGLTGKELGQMVDTTKVTMSNIENGKQKLNLEMALEIFTILDIDFKEILEEYRQRRR